MDGFSKMPKMKTSETSSAIKTTNTKTKPGMIGKLEKGAKDTDNAKKFKKGGAVAKKK